MRTVENDHNFEPIRREGLRSQAIQESLKNSVPPISWNDDADYDLFETQLSSAPHLGQPPKLAELHLNSRPDFASELMLASRRLIGAALLRQTATPSLAALSNSP